MCLAASSQRFADVLRYQKAFGKQQRQRKNTPPLPARLTQCAYPEEETHQTVTAQFVITL